MGPEHELLCEDSSLVQLAKEANINKLRIFGWHPPEVDGFYELCDELGITVWQDLIPLASVSLPLRAPAIV